MLGIPNWSSSTRTQGPVRLGLRKAPMTAEQVRLDEARDKQSPWKKWGPYLSERQWGSVRADYSEGGNAWDG